LRKARPGSKRVGLGHRLLHYPAQLSGASTRVAIARAFIAEPKAAAGRRAHRQSRRHHRAPIVELLFACAPKRAPRCCSSRMPRYARRCDRIVALADGASPARRRPPRRSRAAGSAVESGTARLAPRSSGSCAAGSPDFGYSWAASRWVSRSSRRWARWVLRSRPASRACAGAPRRRYRIHPRSSASRAGRRAYLAGAGDLSLLIQMRAMARTLDGDRRSLIELKAVDRAYPLYGAVTLAPAASLSDAFAQRDGHWGAVVAPALMDRLAIKVGDVIRIGDGDFTCAPRSSTSPTASAASSLWGRACSSARTRLPRPGCWHPARSSISAIACGSHPASLSRP